MRMCFERPGEQLCLLWCGTCFQLSSILWVRTWGVCRSPWASSRRTGRPGAPGAPPPDCPLSTSGLSGARERESRRRLKREVCFCTETPERVLSKKWTDAWKKSKPLGFSLSLRNSSKAFPSLGTREGKEIKVHGKQEGWLCCFYCFFFCEFSLVQTHSVSRASPLLHGCLCTSTMSGCSCIISSSSSLTLAWAPTCGF